MTEAATVTITIDSIGAKGDGVGRLPDGRRVFVSGVLPGETVAVALGAARDDGLAGRLERVLTPSENRIAPACRHFGTCGGCVLQHMNGQGYSAFKMDQVRKTLERAGLDLPEIDGPHISPPGARRRVTMAAYRAGQRLVIGFNESRSNKIVPLSECPVIAPRFLTVLPALHQALLQVLEDRQGMDISMMESGGAIDVVLRPWTKFKPAGKRKAGDSRIPLHILETLSAFAEQADIARLSWQNSATDEADLTPVLWRKPFTVNFSGTVVTPSPGAFLQATKQGEAALVRAVTATLTPPLRVADLYAGCGTFTFALSAAGHKVHAVEGFAPALQALRDAMPGRPVTAEKRDLARDPLGEKELKNFDAVVLDPPRIGAKEQIAAIAWSDIAQVVYVSCSPASFARDGAVLSDAGFTLEKLTVIDQFLWTPHVELVGVFKR